MRERLSHFWHINLMEITKPLKIIKIIVIQKKFDMMFRLKQIITGFYSDYEYNCGNEYVHMYKSRKKHGK